MLLMLFPLSLSRQVCDNIKAVARDQFPRVKSSHLTEAIAAGFDYRNNAAMRAALDANRAPGYFALVRFGKRLCELGYDPPADVLADGSMPWSAQCLFSLMVAAACQKGDVVSSARLPIAQSMERMKEAGCGNEGDPPRPSVANPAWLRRGPHGKQFSLFIEQFGDAIEDINKASFSVEESSGDIQWKLLRSVSFEEPFSEGLVFSLSDTAARFARLALSGGVNYTREKPTESRIDIALDAYTLEKFGVDQKAYEDCLAAALSDHQLAFSMAADRPMATGIAYGIDAVSGASGSDRLVKEAAATVWPTVVRPRIEAIKALDGKIFATLSADERQVFDFYRDRGRKYGVTVGLIQEGNPDELMELERDQAGRFLRTNSKVRVIAS